MKFSIVPIVVSHLALSAHGAPNSIPEVPEIRAVELATSVELITLDNFNQTQVFTFAPQASCSILKCIDVIGDAICIVNAIRKKDFKGILKCADKKALCGCAGCIDDLGDFLTEYGIC